jgi:hypothetical protein
LFPSVRRHLGGNGEGEMWSTSYDDCIIHHSADLGPAANIVVRIGAGEFVGSYRPYSALQRRRDGKPEKFCSRRE